MKMKHIVVLLATSLLLLSGAALADNYQLTVGWTDPTVYTPTDTPTYEARYRIAGGAETVVPGVTPAISATIIAVPGDPVEVAVRALNQELSSPWTAWVTATAPYPATPPEVQTSLSITLVHTGQ